MKTSRRRLGAGGLAVAAALGVALAPRAARAACEDVDRAREAAAFRQGLQRYRDGDTAGAVEIWKGLLNTLGVTCGWKVLFNLGRAYEKLGDPTRAIESYSAFVAAAEKQKLDAKEARLEQEARDGIAALKAKYGALVVAAPDSGMVLVRVGASDPQPAGFTTYLVPGTHDVELFARTAKATTRSVTVRAGQVTELTIPGSGEVTQKPARDAPAAEPPRRVEASPQRQGSKFPTALVAVGSGLTLAAAGTTVFFWTQQASKRDEAEALSRADPEYAKLREDHSDARSAYYVSLVVAGAFATATAAVVMVHVLTSDSTPVRAQAGISPGAANVSVTGRF